MVCCLFRGLGEVLGWGGAGCSLFRRSTERSIDKGGGALIYRRGKALPQRYGLPEAISKWILRMTAMMVREGLSQDLKSWCFLGFNGSKMGKYRKRRQVPAFFNEFNTL
jgi:hypothetical protein